MRYGYGIDITYIILVLPCLIFALWASANVKSTFQKYSKINNNRGVTGAQAATQVLRANGILDVRVDHISGELTDHFDPTNRVIRLSDSVYDSPSVAAIGVACHEAGHAVQHSVGYLPIHIRSAIIPITNIGSKLAIPLIVVGSFLSGLSTIFYNLIYVGIAFFGLSVIFQLVTLPVEFNASNRAMKAMTETSLLSDQELKYARKTLSAAALTYVAATATAIAQFLRFVMMFSGNRRRR